MYVTLTGDGLDSTRSDGVDIALTNPVGKYTMKELMRAASKTFCDINENPSVITDSDCTSEGYHRNLAFVLLDTDKPVRSVDPNADPVTFKTDAYTLALGPMIARENFGAAISLLGVKISIVNEKFPGMRSRTALMVKDRLGILIVELAIKPTGSVVTSHIFLITSS